MGNWKEESHCFDDFIVGDANKMALDKAKEFSAPSCDFYLLYINGNVGSGKTYLTKIVETELIAQNNWVKMLNSEQFVSELIWYVSRNIENNGSEVFCREYEKYDVLILDDIHFLEGKETSQKYLAYLLEDFVGKRKKVLLTSIKALSEYSWLQDVLSENAMKIEQVQIQDADRALKKQILEKLQIEWEYKISEASEDLIVEKAKNIREVEGYLKRVMAYHQLLGIENVEEMLE